MKKIFLTLVLLTGLICTRANIITPRAWISEILVDSSGAWSIEMGFFEYMSTDIDSVRIFTSSGSSLIANYDVNINGHYNPFDSLSVITSANLVDPLSIDPDGDFVRLVSYIFGIEAMDEIKFGNYPGSFLNCMHPGESVFCVGWGDFAIDNSPTIGISNEFNYDGFLGGFYGRIMDLNGNPIDTGFVTTNGLYCIVISPDSQGNFSELVLSRQHTFDTIYHYIPPWPYNKQIYTVEPVDFCVPPDSSHYQDIITTSLVIGVEETEKPDENLVTIAPNPFSEKVDFYFNTNNKEAMRFSIFSLDGKRILQTQLNEDQRIYEWRPSAEIPSGTYIYRLEKSHHVLKTGKFLRL